jgi:hypothetical protein
MSRQHHVKVIRMRHVLILIKKIKKKKKKKRKKEKKNKKARHPQWVGGGPLDQLGVARLFFLEF